MPESRKTWDALLSGIISLTGLRKLMEISRLFSENVADRGDRLSKLAADVDGSKNFEPRMIDTAVNSLTNESDHVERKGPRKWRRPTSLPIVLEPALQGNGIISEHFV